MVLRQTVNLFPMGNTGGSNPSPPTKFWIGSSAVERGTLNPCVVGSIPTRFTKMVLVEIPKYSTSPVRDGDAAPAATIKMGTEIRGISSAGRASDLHSEGQRFDPVILHHFARIAHQVEQLICNHQVVGSSPAAGTINGLVAQLVRVSACHAEGREFKSRPDRQTKKGAFLPPSCI